MLSTVTEQSREFDLRQSYGLNVVEKGTVQHLLFNYVVRQVVVNIQSVVRFCLVS